MIISRLTILSLFVCLSCDCLFAQLKVSILGDSYSTFEGYLAPEANLSWYTVEQKDYNKGNDVSRVEDTWWYKLTSNESFVLDINNSYSGSTICHTGYKGEDCSYNSFITRLHYLGNPDVILVFGGSNDDWAGVSMGNFQYSSWDKKQLYTFRPAFAYMLNQLRELYPEVRIINIINSGLSHQITESMIRICEHYNVENLLLHDIDKLQGHPSKKGMSQIYSQVKSVLDLP